MAIAGKYQVVVASPDGNIDAVIELAESGGAYSGTLKAQGNNAVFRDLKVDGDNFASAVTINYDMDTFNATIKGAVDGDALSGVINTPYMPVSYKGKRV